MSTRTPTRTPTPSPRARMSSSRMSSSRTSKTNLTTIFEDITLPDNNQFDIGQVVQFKKDGSERLYTNLGVITHIDKPTNKLDSREYFVTYLVAGDPNLRQRRFKQKQANDTQMTFIAKKLKNVTYMSNLTLLRILKDEVSNLVDLEENLPDTGGGNQKTKLLKSRRNKTKRRRRRRHRHY